MEIEAKLIIRRLEQVDQVLDTLAAVGYSVAGKQTGVHTDTYFDTRDRSIMQAGWAYRFRQCAGNGTLTLKSFGARHGAVFVREEIDQQLPDQLLAREGAIPPGPVREKLQELIGDERPDELFEIRTRRTVFTMNTPARSGFGMELDLDQSVVRAEKTRKRATGRLEFTELEIESGDKSAVMTLARTLHEQIGLAPAQFSKFDRGLYAAGIRLDHRQPKTARLRGKDPVLKLIFQHLQQQLSELKRYQLVASEGIDSEGVHKMRVAIRRLQSVLRTFRKILAADVHKKLEGELSWAARQLGKARDADVCEIKAHSDDPESLTDAPTTAAYRDHLRQLTIDSYRNLADVFDGERYSKLIARLEKLVAGGSGAKTGNKYGDLRIAVCADRYVRAKTRKMLKRGNRITSRSNEKHLHNLRRAAKRLRYILDFFSTAQRKRWRKKIAALQKLQDLLGEHQDAVMALKRHKAYIESMDEPSSDSDLAASIDRLIKADEKQLARCRDRFGEVWLHFARIASQV